MTRPRKGERGNIDHVLKLGFKRVHADKRYKANQAMQMEEHEITGKDKAEGEQTKTKYQVIGIMKVLAVGAKISMQEKQEMQKEKEAKKAKNEKQNNADNDNEEQG